MTPGTSVPAPVRQVLLLMVAVAMSVGAASAQSLGELARLEAERRKTIETPSKIYTNASLRPVPPPAQPAPAAPAPAPAPSGAQLPSPSGTPPGETASAEPAAPEEAARDEAYWRQRIQAARDARARAQTFADALQSRINALSTDFAARDDPAQRETIATDRQKALAELDRVRQEIEQHTKSIAAIQDEARRAAVPPGWLR